MQNFRRNFYLDKIDKELSDQETILFLIGARQVGKTTLLHSLVDFDYISKDKSFFIYGDDVFAESFQTGNDFLMYCQNFIDIDNLEFLIIDEAQYITNIGIILKGLIDMVRRKKYSFKIIVSGSGSLNVFKGMTDSLIGKKKIIYVNTFSFDEFLQYKGIQNISYQSPNINLYLSYFQEYSLWGGYPKVVMTSNLEQKKNILLNLVNDYILKDVILLLNSNEILKFKEFLTVLSSKIGSTITIQTILDEIGISRYVAEKYLFVLENTFLLHTIKPFVGGKVSGEIKKKMKLYCNDIGLLRVLLGGGDLVGDLKGKVIENFVANSLLIHKKDFERLFFWCTKSGGEVDFILEDKFTKQITPVEVKSGNKNNIPKSFGFFYETYKDIIKSGYITTNDMILEREMGNSSVYFFPFVFIKKIFED